ncbi:MAG: TauD/TfdA family dioxygenase [Proteobacteria bacterium]|nr:TauD/TfdA family dioxygenase [Pseudomonadota bacterium]
MITLPEGAVVRPLTAHLATEIRGFDVKRIGNETGAKAVRSLLFDRGVLVFKDQDLSPDDLLAFTRLFGEPETPVLGKFTLPGFRNIYVLSNIVENGRPLGSRFDGYGWHTDLSYKERPSAYTALYGVKVPPEGGDTLFASVQQAFLSFSEDERDRIRPLTANYSYVALYETRREPNKPPLSAEQRAQNPDCAHPVVRIHPETGREGIYIGLDDCTGVNGMTPSEGRALIKRLYDIIAEPRFLYRHGWSVNDLVIWDNRMVMHTATPYDMDRWQRLLYRTTVIGERPIGWSNRASIK